MNQNLPGEKYSQASLDAKALFEQLRFNGHDRWILSGDSLLPADATDTHQMYFIDDALLIADGLRYRIMQTQADIKAALR